MIDLDELEKTSSDPFLVYSFNRETVLELIAEIRKLRSEVDRVWAIHNEFLNGAYFQRGEELHKLREANGVMKNGLFEIKNGGVPNGVFANVTDRMLVQCMIAQDALTRAAQIMGVEK